MLKTEYIDNFSEFYKQYKDHIEKHYNDYADTFGGDRVINADLSLFQNLIDAGSCNLFTLWDEEEFIGYISITISPSVLFEGEVDAIVDHLYLTEDARGKGFAKQVFKEIEDQLKSDGIKRYSVALPVLDKYNKFIEKLGFVKQSVICSKKLGDI